VRKRNNGADQSVDGGHHPALRLMGAIGRAGRAGERAALWHLLTSGSASARREVDQGSRLPTGRARALCRAPLSLGRHHHSLADLTNCREEQGRSPPTEV
jgi:hypothetical protein